MHQKTTRVLIAAAALAAGGAVTAGIAGAARSGKDTNRRAFPFGARHPGFPHDEPALTGETREKAEAAAIAAVPGGKVWRSSEEDPAEGTGAKYEVHLAAADGTPVEV